MAGLLYVRRSALLMMLLYPAFLLVPGVVAKLVLIAAVGLGNTGWYAILKGQLYSTLPGQSGTVMAISSGVGIVAGVIPALLGIVAERFGLPVTMWLLLLGPMALWVGMSREIVKQ
jgi:FSR family fosmidomycin resistance protein-like MFS transporter